MRLPSSDNDIVGYICQNSGILSFSRFQDYFAGLFITRPPPWTRTAKHFCLNDAKQKKGYTSFISTTGFIFILSSKYQYLSKNKRAMNCVSFLTDT